METELTIQQVAALTGLSMHTLRYYERIGLLDPIHRASSGQRRYSEGDIAWIEFLMRLRATGMSICKMQQFADLRRQGPTTIGERSALLEAHSQDVQHHLQELHDHLAAIEKKMKLYQELEQTYDTAREYQKT